MNVARYCFLRLALLFHKIAHMCIFHVSLLAEVSHDEAKMRERRERVSLLSLIFALSWETSASREISRWTLTKSLWNFVSSKVKPQKEK